MPLIKLEDFDTSVWEESDVLYLCTHPYWAGYFKSVKRRGIDIPKLVKPPIPLNKGINGLLLKAAKISETYFMRNNLEKEVVSNES